jgi:putative ABC transport system permease protein
VDVNTAFLDDTGTAAGGQYTLSSGGRHVTVRIAGEVLDTAGGGPVMIGGLATLSAVDPGLSPSRYQVALAPGTDVSSYLTALSSALGPGYLVTANTKASNEIDAVLGLVAMLTLLVAVVAGLGVLNAVVLQTRERVHDLGVFKAVGMTPRQIVAMVLSSVGGTGLAAGLIAIPAGIALHWYVLPVMGRAAQTGIPASVLDAYDAPGLLLLALSGVVIAIAGGLAPAGWAARTRTASALRAE